MRSGLLLLSILLAAPALADETSPSVSELMSHTRLWPVTLDVHLMVGAEPHGARGTPVAMGVGAEVFWKGRVGAFASLLSSEGTPILPRQLPGGTTDRALADRISIPFGLAARPFAHLGIVNTFARRLVAGIGLQAGISVEHLRVSDDDATVAALHLGASLDVPLVGGPMEGGLMLRLYGRLSVTSDTTLDPKNAPPVFENGISGQLFGGLCYYP